MKEFAGGPKWSTQILIIKLPLMHSSLLKDNGADQETKRLNWWRRRFNALCCVGFHTPANWNMCTLLLTAKIVHGTGTGIPDAHMLLIIPEGDFQIWEVRAPYNDFRRINSAIPRLQSSWLVEDEVVVLVVVVMQRSSGVMDTCPILWGFTRHNKEERK